MREMGQPGIDQGEKVQVSRRKKVAAVADRVASGVLSKTVAPVARFAGKRLLGEVPDYAKEGSYHAEQKKAEAALEAEDVGDDLKREITSHLAQERTNGDAVVDKEDEAMFEKIYSQEAGEAPKDKQDSVIA
jgi:hypothetical protein